MCLSVFVEACQCLLTVFMLHPFKIVINTSCSDADSHFCHSRLTEKNLYIKETKRNIKAIFFFIRLLLEFLSLSLHVVVFQYGTYY
jgi:hypothetical protein